jgi:hypothetical protein
VLGEFYGRKKMSYLFDVVATIIADGETIIKEDQVEAEDTCMISIMQAFKKKFNKSRRKISKNYKITRLQYTLINRTN